VGVGFFCPIPDAQFDHFLHHTPKLGISIEMVQFLLKLLLNQVFFAYNGTISFETFVKSHIFAYNQRFFAYSSLLHSQSIPQL